MFVHLFNDQQWLFSCSTGIYGCANESNFFSPFKMWSYVSRVPFWNGLFIMTPFKRFEYLSNGGWDLRKYSLLLACLWFPTILVDISISLARWGFKVLNNHTKRKEWICLPKPGTEPDQEGVEKHYRARLSFQFYRIYSPAGMTAHAKDLVPVVVIGHSTESWNEDPTHNNQNFLNNLRRKVVPGTTVATTTGTR